MLLETTPRIPQAEEHASAAPVTAPDPIKIAGMLALIVALASWALATYQPLTAPYGDRTVFLFPLLILLVDLGAQWLAYRSLKHESTATSQEEKQALSERPLALPQVTLPMYLACAVLLSTQIAVLVALIIEGFSQLVAVIRHRRRVERALAMMALAGTLALAGGVCYQMLLEIARAYGIAGLFSIRLGAGLASALAMLALCPLATLPEKGSSGVQGVLRRWPRYFRTSEARFQVLLLSIGPLLPLAEGLDDLEAELAWILFLVPLFAIYYLALVSLRFQRQTEVLAASLRALRQARRRQAELHEYAALITRAQEDERRRLSRELHDDTAQALIALSRGLEGLVDARNAGRTLAADDRWVEDLRELADRSLESVRRACRDLRPSVLDDLGLAAALDWLAEQTIQRGLPCVLRVEGKRFSVSGEAELVFFRIAQEALANAWRHARARQAEVLLDYRPSVLRLCVRDDGRGFDLAQGEEPRESGAGLGLLGMRERAALVGAELMIRSTPGQGTTVEVRLALPAPA
ncbi:MAG TPA: sensor histidine kinase [Ktedonobacterales bacterium]|jgi:signal transduction histidine kinase